MLYSNLGTIFGTSKHTTTGFSETNAVKNASNQKKTSKNFFN